MSEPEALVAALYHFAPIEDPTAFAQPLRERAEALGIRGTLLVASEGLNGTLSGDATALRTLLSWIRQQHRFDDLEHKESWHPAPPFQRLKVKIKAEVVTMRADDADPRAAVGAYVDPAEWNALVKDPDVVLVDVRNDFEVAYGSFRGARNPATKQFSDFPQWLSSSPDAPRPDQKVAMFCTGGIRCERATAYMVARGYGQVFHLKGGILNYLENTQVESSEWQGECFVFDERVALDHDLRATGTGLCPECSGPIPARENVAPCARCGAPAASSVAP